MKIGFLFASILAMAGTCWWAIYKHDGAAPLGWRDKRRIVVQSLVTGVVVYFVLVLVAALYMTWA